MQIVIPMSGFGERFRRAGDKVPKPLIEIEGKPLIAHVIDMFPGEKDFIFICNEDHLNDPRYRMKEILKTLCPTGKIFGIAAHKLGPVHAVLQVENIIDEEKPTIVNYCDFTCYWDWQHFKKFVKNNSCTGAIPSYKGFHPHTLGSTNYAYMKEKDGWVEDIQEKQPYTNDRMNEFASSGTYYFSSAKIMKESFAELIEKGIDLNGEYYVSLAYKILCKKVKSVAIYPLQHFMQWGTPEDVVEYNYWSKTFSLLSKTTNKIKKPIGSIVIPMAGLGMRFANEGYDQTKPLIPVSGTPMVIQAAKDLPAGSASVFVVRSDMPDYSEVEGTLKQFFPDAVIETIDHVTEGQACTAMIGVQALVSSDKENLMPVTIGPCDSGAIYNEDKFLNLLNDDNVDVIVWGVRGHANAIRNPEMFGWIGEENGGILSVSVKKPLSNPMTDPVVIGTFTFKKIEDFNRATENLIKRNGRINGEFYMDSCIEDAIELGLNCALLEVDSYLGWGTPNDLKTFNYWQSCFHLWNTHPYELSKDKRIEKNKILEIDTFFRSNNPVNNLNLGD